MADYSETGKHNLTLEDCAHLETAAKAYAQAEWEIVEFFDDPSEAFAEWYLLQCEEATDHDLTGPNQYPQMYWPPLNFDTWRKWREETADGNNLRAMVEGRKVAITCLHPANGDHTTKELERMHWNDEQRIACGCVCAECREY